MNKSAWQELMSVQVQDGGQTHRKENWLVALINTAAHAFKRDTAYFAPRHVYAGLLAAIGFPLYYAIWHNVFPQP